MIFLLFFRMWNALQSAHEDLTYFLFFGILRMIQQYNVINLDITSFISSAAQVGISLQEIPGMIADAIREEVLALDAELPTDKDLGKILTAYVDKQGNEPFIFIIDEWDAMIREAKDDPEAQKRYLNLLRGWFKNSSFTPKVCWIILARTITA